MTVALLVGRLLRRGVGGTLALVAGILVFQLLEPLIADSMGGAQGLQSLVETLPPGMQAIARLDPQFVALSGLAGFLSFGYTHPLYLVLISSAMVGFAARSLAGEIDRGTIAVALARPISRHSIYAARVAGLVALSAALSLAGTAGTLIGVLVARPEGELTYAHLVQLTMTAALLAWAIGGLTLWASAGSSTSGRVVGMATAVLVISYFVDYFADVWSVLEPLAPYSLFNYFDPAHALVNGAIRPLDAAVLSLSGLIGVVAGALIFDRRDLPV